MTVGRNCSVLVPLLFLLVGCDNSNPAEPADSSSNDDGFADIVEDATDSSVPNTDSLELQQDVSTAGCTPTPAAIIPGASTNAVAAALCYEPAHFKLVSHSSTGKGRHTLTHTLRVPLEELCDECNFARNP